MKEKILNILNEDIKDLEEVDFGFNYLFIKHYYKLKDRIENAEDEVIEELDYNIHLFQKLNTREENRSSYYGRKLSLYTMNLDRFIR